MKTIHAIALILLGGLLFWLPICLAQAPALPRGLEKEASNPEKSGTGTPALPEGLEQKQKGESEPAEEGPALPSGLGGEEPSGPSGPSLPSGLGREKPAESRQQAKQEESAFSLPENLTGFGEARGGVRIDDDPVNDDVSLAELRLQLSYDRYLADILPRGVFRVTGDLIFDAVDDEHDVDLEEGEGFIDLRELWLSFTPLEFLDLKAGRQILTWGTGNFIFLNDLFPKDYQSFFLGRHIDYLKAPSDAIKASLYSDAVNLDLVYTPRFDADRFVSGERLSFYDPAMDRLRGEERALRTERPDSWFDDDEVALRIHRNVDVYEVAAYAYYGFWKSPSGSDPQTGRGTFPPLSAYGASIRGPVGPGIGNAEFAWYESRDDRDGDDPLVENSQLRFLVGYEMEMATDLTVGLQYYLEYMLDHQAYQETLPQDIREREEDRHWITLDINKELLAQNQLVLGLFLFYAPATGDAYFRPTATYDLTDHWKLQAGGNLFTGDRDTFFGQFEKNSNIYGAVRYSF